MGHFRLWKYAYITSKVRGMRSHLLTEDFRAFVESSGLDETRHILEATVYRDELSAVPTESLTSIALEKALVGNFLKTFNGIWKYSSEDIKTLLEGIQRKFEVENIKAILRAKIAELSVEDVIQYLIPIRSLDEIRCRELLEKTETVEDVIGLLRDAGYRQALEGALEDYREIGFLIPLESALDNYVIGELWKNVHKLKGLDVKVAEELLGTEIDILNMKVILRSKALAIGEDYIRRFLLPVFYALTNENIAMSIKADGVENAIHELEVKYYEKTLAEALKAYRASNSVFPVELVLDRLLLKTNQAISVKHPSPFHIGVLLAFLNLKWFEVKNLRSIVVGKENKVPSEKIWESLVI